MARAKTTKKAPSKTSKKTAKKATKTTKTTKSAGRKSAPKRKSKAVMPTRNRKIEPGFVSHTELASADPEATVKWTKKALGWKFGASMPTPNGPYHMWSFGKDMGGGIRMNGPGENTGSIPYCEVPVMKTAYNKAIKAGATPLMPPQPIEGGFGTIAVVMAPGGVAIGFWSPK